jgi:predicted cupin superfamily sugar epimerase
MFTFDQTSLPMSTIKQIIKNYDMLSHPEGGWYKETYRSNDTTTINGLGTRNLMTSIYFLLESHQVSNFHIIKSDELWFSHSGSALTVHCIYPNGDYKKLHIGPDFEKGQTFQAVVPKGTIFGSSVDEPNTFSMVGCTVSPGFDFEDFKLFTQEELLDLYPQHSDIIKKLTPNEMV